GKVALHPFTRAAAGLLVEAFEPAAREWSGRRGDVPATLVTPGCVRRDDRKRRPALWAGLGRPVRHPLSSLATVGSSLRRDGRTCPHVHSDGSLSGRKRSSRVPWRKRWPCTLS